MFNQLSNQLSSVFQKLRGKGFLNEEDVNTALREVRIALLEADVALPVAKQFIENIRQKAVGEKIIQNVNPAHMVVKIVNDEMVALLGSEATPLNLNSEPPAVILMCGLQGSGKTTSSAKLALWLKDKQKKKALLASLDTSRPAAQEQLAMLGQQLGIASLPIVAGEKPLAITKRALKTAKLEGYDVLILDTAGRMQIDEALMEEVKEISKLSKPTDTILVADSLTGQEAVNVAKAFKEALPLTSIILTRLDGDGRGGAALSMRHVTGCPITFVGVGEKPSAFEPFHPERMASRILGMGDVVSLVEKASEMVDKDVAEKMAKRMKKGQFDFNDLLQQLQQIKKLSSGSGGLMGILGMLPGANKIQNAIEQQGGIDESIMVRQQAIIQSMTKQERQFPAVMNGSRKRRIASGSGTTVQDVNKLIKQHKQMQTMMKKLGSMRPADLMRQMKGMGGMGGA